MFEIQLFEIQPGEKDKICVDRYGRGDASVAPGGLFVQPKADVSGYFGICDSAV